VAVSCPQRHIVERFRRAGVLAFDDPTVALRSLACLAHATRLRPRWLGRTTAARPGARPRAEAAAAPASAEGFLSEWESRRLLEPYGLPLVPATLVRDADAARRAADALGYPAVVKICSPDLPHKSEAGAVALGRADARAVEDACRGIASSVARQAPAARIEGFLVQPEARGQLELALGVEADPVFGPIVMVGAGGVLIEALRDFRLLVPPVDAAAAEEALRALRIGALWEGPRGRPALDLPAAVDLLVRLGEAASALAGIAAEMDLNPVLVRERGQGVVVLDALVRLAPGLP
jgi:acyl-CoA synthetase (NDP forming)